MRRSSHAAATVVSLGVLLLLSLASAPGATHGGGTLRVVVSADFGAIEPALVGSNDGLQVMSATQLGLISLSERASGPRFLPYAAARLPTISRDGKTYAFRIRPDLRFSDGSRVTARNFVAGLERLLDPRLHASRAFLFDDVSGAHAFRRGKAPRVAGVTATKNRLAIHLRRPAPDLLDRLALPIVTAMPLDLPIVSGGVGAPLPSAGPYYVQAYEPGRRALLVRNPHWNRHAFRSRPANVEEIEYLGRAPAEAVAAVSRGDADVATFLGGEQLAPDLVRDLKSRYGVNRERFFVRPRLARVGLVFNFRRPLFGNDAKLRRAVNLALDRTQLAAAHGPLAGMPTDQLLLPGRAGFHDWALYPRRANIAAAKHAAGSFRRPRELSLYVPTTPWGPLVAATVRSSLAPLGLRVRVNTLPSGVFVAALSLSRTRWDLAAWVWGALRADPVAFINFPLDGRYISQSPPGFNLGHFNEPKWNARMRLVARTMRGRDAAYALLDRDLMRRAAPLAPYLVENALTVVSERVECFSSMTNGWPNLATLCLK
jgi:peptide/nickel transport system substrate-binding protein